MNNYIIYELYEWVKIKNLDYYNLSCNPAAIDILEKNIDKINWTNLSSNPAAIGILEKNIDKINWSNLSDNPNIFKIKYNYSIISKEFEPLKEELCKLFYHPKRIDFQYMIYNEDKELDYDKQFSKSVISILNK